MSDYPADRAAGHRHLPNDSHSHANVDTADRPFSGSGAGRPLERPGAPSDTHTHAHTRTERRPEVSSRVASDACMSDGHVNMAGCRTPCSASAASWLRERCSSGESTAPDCGRKTEREKCPGDGTWNIGETRGFLLGEGEEDSEAVLKRVVLKAVMFSYDCNGHRIKPATEFSNGIAWSRSHDSCI